MDREKAHALLDDLASGLGKQFTAPEQAARLDQLDAHLATVHMVVDHLYDESER